MGESRATGKRPLRSTAVVRELILNGARACFAESGYAGTSTRQIASRAGVVENLIYKQFGMVAFNAAFGESLYPDGVEAPGRQRVVDEAAAFMVHGTAHRPS